MKVYLHGDTTNNRLPPAEHLMFVCPAAFNPQQQDIPHGWVDHENKPITFQILFRFGTAEVEDDLGKYLTDPAIGMAKKSRLLLPEGFHW